MRGLLRRLRGVFAAPNPDPIDPERWREVRASLPWLQGLDDARSARLAALAAHFLADKTITALDGLVLDDLQRAQLAALCCLPLLRFGKQGLHGWAQLLVYPAAFRVGRSHVDAAGVMHQWDEALIGESWQAGPLILSWADVRADIADPRAGFCVAVHEMAHKLDALDGVVNGTPALPRAWQREWVRDFQQAFDALVDDVERGRRVAIDDYAAQAPEEFFAVCSEYHFSDPRTLQQAMPKVAAHLERFYGPSPLATMPPS